MTDEWRPTGDSASVALHQSTAHSVARARRYVWVIGAIIIAVTFIWAGASKALDPIRFARDIDNYKVLPWTAGVALAFYLPWLEILCGVAVFLKLLSRAALCIATGLLVVFLIATVTAKIRGLDITCGCFGHASQNWSFPAHLSVDVALLAVASGLLMARRSLGPTVKKPG